VIFRGFWGKFSVFSRDPGWADTGRNGRQLWI